MDDIYEFDNNEYRIAAMQIKAIAYDVITEITKKRMQLAKIAENDKMNNLISIQDKLVEITDEFDRQLETLDQFEKENIASQQEPEPTEEKNSKVEPRVIAEIKSELSKNPLEEKNEEINTSEINNTIDEQKTDTEIKTTETSTDLPIPKDNTQEEIHSQDTIQQDGNIEEHFNKNQENPTTSKKSKKRFQKTTKELSKAIMVRQNQLANLIASKPSQEKILIDKGILEAEGEQKEETIELQKPQKKELSDEIERQIEDLTVKANIYYNEGEIDKAQELYEKIKELSKQN